MGQEAKDKIKPTPSSIPFLPSKVEDYVKRLEQLSKESKEILSPENYFLLMLEDFESKRSEEKSSRFKPDFFYKDRQVHMPFSRAFTQQRRPAEFKLKPFLQELEKHAEHFTPEDLPTNRFFARMIASLHYSEACLIMQDKKIPSKFKQALSNYEVDYLLKLTASKHIPLKIAAIKSLSSLSIDSGSTQFAKMVEAFSSLSKKLIHTRDLLVTEDWCIKEGAMEEFIALITSPYVGSDERDDMLDNLRNVILYFSKHVEKEQCRLIEVLGILATSANMNTTQHGRVIKFLGSIEDMPALKADEKSKPIPTKPEIKTAFMKALYQVGISSTPQNCETAVQKLLEHCDSSNARYAIKPLVSLILNSTVSSEQRQLAIKKLAGLSQNIALDGLALLAASPRVEEKERSSILATLRKELNNIDPRICHHVVTVLGVFGASSQADEQRKFIVEDLEEANVDPMVVIEALFILYASPNTDDEERKKIRSVVSEKSKNLKLQNENFKRALMEMVEILTAGRELSIEHSVSIQEFWMQNDSYLLDDIVNKLMIDLCLIYSESAFKRRIELLQTGISKYPRGDVDLQFMQAVYFNLEVYQAIQPAQLKEFISAMLEMNNIMFEKEEKMRTTIVVGELLFRGLRLDDQQYKDMTKLVLYNLNNLDSSERASVLKELKTTLILTKHNVSYLCKIAMELPDLAEKVDMMHSLKNLSYYLLMRKNIKEELNTLLTSDVANITMDYVGTPKISSSRF